MSLLNGIARTPLKHRAPYRVPHNIVAFADLGVAYHQRGARYRAGKPSSWRSLKQHQRGGGMGIETARYINIIKQRNALLASRQNSIAAHARRRIALMARSCKQRRCSGLWRLIHGALAASAWRSNGGGGGIGINGVSISKEKRRSVCVSEMKRNVNIVNGNQAYHQ